MALIADGLLIARAMTAGLYCLVLSRRLKRLTDSGSGIGQMIAALDVALGRAEAALNETRDGVSELRGSTKTLIVQLARETGEGHELAARIERSIEDGKATLQRLCEAHARMDMAEVGARFALDGMPGTRTELALVGTA